MDIPAAGDAHHCVMYVYIRDNAVTVYVALEGILSLKVLRFDFVFTIKPCWGSIGKLWTWFLHALSTMPEVSLNNPPGCMPNGPCDSWRETKVIFPAPTVWQSLSSIPIHPITCLWFWEWSGVEDKAVCIDFPLYFLALLFALHQYCWLYTRKRAGQHMSLLMEGWTVLNPLGSREQTHGISERRISSIL